MQRWKWSSLRNPLFISSLLSFLFLLIAPAIAFAQQTASDYASAIPGSCQSPLSSISQEINTLTQELQQGGIDSTTMELFSQEVDQGTSGDCPFGAIAGVQGYNPATNEYSDNVALPNTYLVLYGSFGQSGNIVLIDNQPATVTYESISQINISLSGIAAGAHTVTVTTPGGDTGTTPFTIGASSPANSLVTQSNTPSATTTNESLISFPATILVDVLALHVRSAPSMTAPLAGSQTLFQGDQFTAVNEVEGEDVEGNDLWWVSSMGNYVWSGGTIESGESTAKNKIVGGYSLGSSQNLPAAFLSNLTPIGNLVQITDAGITGANASGPVYGPVLANWTVGSYSVQYYSLPDGEVEAAFNYDPPAQDEAQNYVGDNFVVRRNGMGVINADGSITVVSQGTVSGSPLYYLVGNVTSQMPSSTANIPGLVFSTPLSAAPNTYYVNGTYPTTITTDSNGNILSVESVNATGYGSGIYWYNLSNGYYITDTGISGYAYLKGGNLPKGYEVVLQNLQINRDSSGNPTAITATALPVTDAQISTNGFVGLSQATNPIAFTLSGIQASQEVNASGLSIVTLSNAPAGGPTGIVTYNDSLQDIVGASEMAAYQYIIANNLNGVNVSATPSDGGYQIADANGNIEATFDSNGNQITGSVSAPACQTAVVSSTISYEGVTQGSGATTYACAYNEDACAVPGTDSTSTLNLFSEDNSPVVPGIHENYQITTYCDTDTAFCSAVSSAISDSVYAYNSIDGAAQGTTVASFNELSSASQQIVIIPVPGIDDSDTDTDVYIPDPTSQQIASSSVLGFTDLPYNFNDPEAGGSNFPYGSQSPNDCYIFILEPTVKTDSQVNLTGVVTHEMGHCFGIAHNNATINVMNSTANNGSSITITPAMVQALIDLHNGTPINLGDYCTAPTISCECGATSQINNFPYGRSGSSGGATCTTLSAGETTFIPNKWLPEYESENNLNSLVCPSTPVTPNPASTSNTCFDLPDGSVTCYCDPGYEQDGSTCVESDACSQDPSASGCPTFCSSNPDDPSCDVCAQNPNLGQCHQCPANQSWSTVSNGCLQNGASVSNICFQNIGGAEFCSCDSSDGYVQNGSSCVIASSTTNYYSCTADGLCLPDPNGSYTDSNCDDMCSYCASDPTNLACVDNGDQ